MKLGLSMTLRRKTVAATGGSGLLVAIFLTVGFTVQMREVMTDELKARARTVGIELANNLAFATFSGDKVGLKTAADVIALDLKYQYRLGYDLPDGPRRFRRVEVRTTRKGILVRTRSGYVPTS